MNKWKWVIGIIVMIGIGIVALTVISTHSSHLPRESIINNSQSLIILNPIIYKKDVKDIYLGENLPSDTEYQNTSFEYLIYDQDKFAYQDGYRPFPWGGEIFRDDIIFQNSSDSHTGNTAFEIIGSNSKSEGVLAVPDIELKPLVTPGKIYYVSFWVKYNIEEGQGIRLMQQFFRRTDYYYPSYSCYGPWLKGNSKGWVHIGMLVQTPKDAWKGDPVLEFVGQGRVLIDDAYFGEVRIDSCGGDRYENSS